MAPIAEQLHQKENDHNDDASAQEHLKRITIPYTPRRCHHHVNDTDNCRRQELEVKRGATWVLIVQHAEPKCPDTNSCLLDPIFGTCILFPT